MKALRLLGMFALALLMGTLSLDTALAYSYQSSYTSSHWNTPYGYFGHSYNHYYPTDYITPARTGLPNSNYFYPNRYTDTSRWFGAYRSYTHAAYRHPGLEGYGTYGYYSYQYSQPPSFPY